MRNNPQITQIKKNERYAVIAVSCLLLNLRNLRNLRISS